MLKSIAAVSLCCLASLLISQPAFASGKMANVVTCAPAGLGGELSIERMNYDNAGPHKFDGVVQLEGRNFFSVKYPLKEKLSEALIQGKVVKKDIRWKGAVLLGYMEESDGAVLPSAKRSATEIIPADAPRHRSPGSEMTMTIEGKTISCAFTSAEQIYSKVSIRFDYDSPNEQSKKFKCAGYPKSYHIKWFTKREQEAVKSETVLASCGFRGPDYDVSVARISTYGRVEVDLERTKILSPEDPALYPRTPEKASEAETP